jgi:DNA-binding CsgD family transcriptional regulator
MPPEEAEVMHLAVLAHESASDPSRWPQFLERCARVVGAEITLLQRHDFSRRHSHAMATFGMQQKFTDSYNQHYSRLNVWRDHGARGYVKGRIVFDEQLYPRQLLKRTEFYNDMLLPNGGTHSAAGVIERRGETALVLTGLRDDSREPFGPEEGRTLEHLLPHLARAFVTQERLAALEGGERALNALSLGVVLLASDARAVFSNRAADDLLRSDDGLRLRNGRLVASSFETDAALQRIVRYAIAPGDSIGCPPDVVVVRTSGRRPYHLAATPLRRRPGPFAGIPAPVALVLVTDPERQRSVGSSALKQAYGLTSREADVALTLAEGEPLQQVADRLEMQYETARTHLRRILSKTGTSRQAELIALLERMSRHLLDTE